MRSPSISSCGRAVDPCIDCKSNAYNSHLHLKSTHAARNSRGTPAIASNSLISKMFPGSRAAPRGERLGLAVGARARLRRAGRAPGAGGVRQLLGSRGGGGDAEAPGRDRHSQRAVRDRRARVRRRRRRGRARRFHRVGGRELRLSRPQGLRVGVAAAAGDARLHRRLRVHRLSPVRGAVAVGAARGLRVGAGRLLVSGDPLAAGRGVRVHRGALSLRLPSRPHRVPRRAPRR